MPKWRIKLWEWDTENGEYVYRDYEGEIIEARDEEELNNIIYERLNEIAREAAEEGWDCEWGAENLLCTKCEEGYCESREIGYDVEPA